MHENDFYTDLQYSSQCSEEPFWQAVYKRAFPNMLFAQPATKNGQGQQLGIDRVIQLDSGKTILIDEKKRRTEYNDILLEYHSNNTKPILDGWMNKDLLVDYIAYAFMKSQKVYLFDWLSLKRAWLSNGSEWFSKAKNKQDGFKIVVADNRYYKTLSIAVPTQVLLSAIIQPIIVEMPQQKNATTLTVEKLLELKRVAQKQIESVRNTIKAKQQPQDDFMSLIDESLAPQEAA